MRDFIVTVFGETYKIRAFYAQRARYLGCKEYLLHHPYSGYKISDLAVDSRTKARVAKDRRVKYR